MKRNSICTGIVTYNRLDLLKGAIESIRSQTEPTDIVVVNNGSTDGTTEYLKTLDDIVVINQDNVGGAGGFFTALKYIAENGYDYAWVMDDDIIAAPDTLTNLYEAYKELSVNETIGFLCSVVMSPEGDTVNIPGISATLNKTGYSDWNKYLDRGYVKVECATFVSVFIPVPVIFEVGLPIKEYFIWGDDTEYTRRITKKYAAYQIGKSKIQHLRNGGALSLRTINDPNRVRMFENFIRNNYHNEKKYGTRISRTKYLYYNLMDSVYFLFHRQFSKTKVILKGLYKGSNFKEKVEFPISKVN